MVPSVRGGIHGTVGNGRTTARSTSRLAVGDEIGVADDELPGSVLELPHVRITAFQQRPVFGVSQRLVPHDYDERAMLGDGLGLTLQRRVPDGPARSNSRTHFLS